MKLLCPWSSPGKNTGVGCHFLLQGIFQPRAQTWVSCIVGRFFIVWTTREAILVSTKKKRILKAWKDMEETQIYISYNVKEVSLKRLHIVWFQLYDNLEKIKEDGDSKKITVSQWLRGREGWIGGAQIFRAVKLLCVMLSWWIRVIRHLSKPTGCTPKVTVRQTTDFGC